MRKTLKSATLRDVTRTNRKPLLAALLGIGTGVSGTLTYQRFKSSDALPVPQPSTQLRDEECRAGLRCSRLAYLDGR